MRSVLLSSSIDAAIPKDMRFMPGITQEPGVSFK